MKLIVQNIDGETFAYLEDERHHKRAEGSRGTCRLGASLLDDECRLSAYENSHFVLDLKEPAKRLRYKR